MIIKLIWLGCSLIVFKSLISYFIKEELSDWGEIDTESLVMFSIISFCGSLFGPIAIIAYIIYNFISGIAEDISEKYNNQVR